MTQAEYLQNLNWRYATKKFDPDKKLTDDQLGFILESIRLAPSSMGLQPYKIFVVTDPTIRQRLFDEAGGQSKFVDASHLLVFAAKTKIDENYVREFIQLNAEVRGESLESLSGFEKSILDLVSKKTTEEITAWTKKQAYIALGFALTACAQFRLDACPMEGFDEDKFNEILGLEAQDLTTAVLCAVGYRDQSDKYSQKAKVRWEKERLFEFV
jgi:nitroreductase